MNSNRLIYAAFAALILCSCDGGRVEEPEKKSSNFSYVDIEYETYASSRVEEIVRENDPIIFNNSSSIEQSYSFDPSKNIYERSTFYSSDTRAFEFVDDGQKVKIPIGMSEEGVLSYDDGTRWNYASGDQRLRPDLDNEIKIDIPANHRLVLTSSFVLRGFATKYKLRLIGVEFGEEIVIEGLWSGSFVSDYDLDYSIEPLP